MTEVARSSVREDPDPSPGSLEPAWQVIGPVSGLAFAGLLAAGMAVGDPNSPETNIGPDQSGAVIAEILTANVEQGRLGLALALVGVFCFIWFVAAVYDRMRQFSRVADVLAAVTLAGGIAGAAALLILMHGGIALTTIQDYGSDPSVARALAAIVWDGVLIAGAPFAAFVLSASLATLGAGVFPRWVGVLGLITAIPLLIMPVAYLGLILFTLWVALVSASWLWRLRSERGGIAAGRAVPQLARS
jgi:hypothetical protein